MHCQIYQKGPKIRHTNVCLVLGQVYKYDNELTRLVGVWPGARVGCLLGQNTVIPGWGSGQTEREAKGSRGKRPGAYTPPPPPSSAWSRGTILAKMFEISGASLKEMMVKGHILCCNWQSAYFNSTPFQRESQISLIEILIEHS